MGASMGWKDLSLKGELVTFRAADGAVLAGFLCRPKGRSRAAILHLHGLNSAFYKVLPLKLGARLAEKGITFMSIQQRGSYNEVALSVYKNNKDSRIVAGGSLERFEDCIYDIEGAIGYLKRMGINRIYLQGHSTGCQKSVFYQIRRKDRAVKGLILLAPGDDYSIWKNGIRTVSGGKRKFPRMVALARSKLKSDPTFSMSTRYEGVRYSARRFLSFADTRNVEARIFNYELPKMREFGRVKVPILAVFGTRDEYLAKPARVCLAILGKNTGSSDFMGVPIKGTNHGFYGKEAEVADLVSGWVAAIEKGR
jgi:pimeloyl-ACP methyl ester carboxylesterase